MISQLQLLPRVVPYHNITYTKSCVISIITLDLRNAASAQLLSLSILRHTTDYSAPCAIRVHDITYQDAFMRPHGLFASVSAALIGQLI